MAINQMAYLPNPDGTENQTVGTSLTSATTDTLYTHPGSKNVRVRNFCITMTCTGATNGTLVGTLKIGTGKYTATLITTSSSASYSVTLSSADCAFDGSWLQSGDTITFTTAQNGANNVTNIIASVSVALEDFTA